MNDNKKTIINKKVQRTIDTLKKNNMDAIFIEKKEDVKVYVEKMLKEGSTIATGGSMSLEECGVMELLRSGKYNFLDRAAVEGDDIGKLYRESFFQTIICAVQMLLLKMASFIMLTETVTEWRQYALALKK